MFYRRSLEDFILGSIRLPYSHGDGMVTNSLDIYRSLTSLVSASSKGEIDPKLVRCSTEL